MGRVLLLVDYENEWADRSSEYYLGNFKGKIARTKAVLSAFRAKNIPIVFTRHVRPESGTAFAEGTKNAEIIGDLKPLAREKVITKNRISPFYKTDLDEFLKLKAADELVVGGIMTNLCVRSAISDAYDRDLAITVVKDICVSDSSKTDRLTFADLKKTRPKVNFVSSRTLIKEVQEQDSE
jgi:nicotinamidase-related amidase